jgi:hypothetical protein
MIKIIKESYQINYIGKLSNNYLIRYVENPRKKGYYSAIIIIKGNVYHNLNKTSNPNYSQTIQTLNRNEIDLYLKGGTGILNIKTDNFYKDSDDIIKMYPELNENLKKHIKEERRLTTEKSQTSFLETIGFKQIGDLTYFGKYPSIKLNEYKEVLPKLNQFEDYNHLTNTPYMKSIIIKNNIIKSSKYFFGYWGDQNGQGYEYGTIANKIVDIYELMKEWDIQEGRIIILSLKNKKYSLIETVYPYEDQYDDFDDFFKSY